MLGFVTIGYLNILSYPEIYDGADLGQMHILNKHIECNCKNENLIEIEVTQFIILVDLLLHDLNSLSIDK